MREKRGELPIRLAAGRRVPVQGTGNQSGCGRGRHAGLWSKARAAGAQWGRGGLEGEELAWVPLTLGHAAHTSAWLGSGEVMWQKGDSRALLSPAQWGFRGRLGRGPVQSPTLGSPGPWRVGGLPQLFLEGRPGLDPLLQPASTSDPVSPARTLSPPRLRGGAPESVLWASGAPIKMGQTDLQSCPGGASPRGTLPSPWPSSGMQPAPPQLVTLPPTGAPHSQRPGQPSPRAAGST